MGSIKILITTNKKKRIKMNKWGNSSGLNQPWERQTQILSYTTRTQ